MKTVIQTARSMATAAVPDIRKQALHDFVAARICTFNAENDTVVSDFELNEYEIRLCIEIRRAIRE